MGVRPAFVPSGEHAPLSPQSSVASSGSEQTEEQPGSRNTFQEDGSGMKGISIGFLDCDAQTDNLTDRPLGTLQGPLYILCLNPLPSWLPLCRCPLVAEEPSSPQICSPLLPNDIRGNDDPHGAASGIAGPCNWGQIPSETGDSCGVEGQGQGGDAALPPTIRRCPVLGNSCF